MALPSTSTRQADYVFLIGIRDLEPLSRFNQLPTLRQVLLRFQFFLHEKNSIRNSSHSTIDELISLWQKAAIPIRLKKHCIDKLEKVHSEWLLLKKNKGRMSDAQKKRETSFQEQLDKIFDIAHNEALTMCKIEEDREFLTDQRTERNMVMTSEDKKYSKKQERILKRRLEEQKRLEKGKEPSSSSLTSQTATISISEDDSSEDSDTVKDKSEEDLYRPSSLKKSESFKDLQSEPIAKKSLFSKHVTSALDRNKVSDREALRLMVPIAAALGHDLSSLPLSRSTIQRKRKKARKDMFEGIKESVSFDDPVIVHWDGKILPDILGTDKVDRLPVLVSADGKEKLLGVPKLERGTGANVANAVNEVLTEWGLGNKIVGMCFDTTSVNTGMKNGACALLEQKVEKDLLWLACRHHILEIVLSKVFTFCFGPSSSPDIPLFKRFKAAWQYINQEDYQPLGDIPGSEDFKPSVVNDLLAALERKNQPRDDYMELIELSLLALGHNLVKVHWRAPGAVHHARWMAKLLYGIKIHLFRDQDGFKTTQKEKSQIERFVKFGVLVYVKYWIEAPMATNAPWSDLSLWNDMIKYQDIDPEISEVVKNALKPHLCYLSDELVGLSLFSKKVSSEDKVAIVNKMKCESEPADRSVRGDSGPLTTQDQAVLADFASKRSYQLFDQLKINASFLNTHPNEWSSNEHYVRGEKIIKNLKVVNDIAERGVKLFEEFNKLLTNDEDEKQLLLQVVEANRKWVPTKTTKQAVVDSLKPSSSKD